MLAYEKTGTGIPLVFLHAFPLSCAMWGPNVERLKNNFQCVCFDFPGFGESPLSSGTPTIQKMAYDVVALLDQLGISERVVFVGLSMGGYVEFELWRQIPERIRALVFCSTRASADTEPIRANRFATIDMVKKEGSKSLVGPMMPKLFGATSLKVGLPMLTQIQQRIEQSNPEAVCAALQAMAHRRDSSETLSQIAVPTLVISGAEDKVVASEEMEKMAQQIPGAEYRVVQEAGHLLNIEKPIEFNDLFLQFLKRKVL